jgi:hypothetical protein
MKFSLKAGDHTVTWQEGHVDDPDVETWIDDNPTFLWHPEGPTLFSDLSDEFTAFCTVFRYLGDTTGVNPEPMDETAQMLLEETTSEPIGAYEDDE